MSQSQDVSESSGYTSTSSEFGSLDEGFKFPTAASRATKRRAGKNVDDLDEMMKEQLTLSPEKRVRLNGANSTSPSAENIWPRQDGRPPTRRVISDEQDMSPRIRTLRAVSSGNAIDMLRTMSAVSSDSISPKLLKQYSSPKRRSSTNENGSIYSKHRLGSTFSPLVAGARKRLGTSSNSFKAHVDKSASINSPKLSGLRKAGELKIKRPLSDRLQDRFGILD